MTGKNGNGGGSEQGTVKFFDPNKKFGFIKPGIGGKDVFVHITAVERAGLTTLTAGQSIKYDRVVFEGKLCAGNLAVP